MLRASDESDSRGDELRCQYFDTIQKAREDVEKDLRTLGIINEGKFWLPMLGTL